MYDFTKKKVFLSRDVIFNEQKFGHDDIGQDAESHKYVYFDCFDDISDSDSHTVEKCLANTREESPANAEEEISGNNDASSVMCIPRHFQLEKRKPDRYGFSCYVTTIEEPVSVKDASMQKEWIGAMSSEMDSLDDNDVWDVVELPKGQKVVGSKRYSN